MGNDERLILSLLFYWALLIVYVDQDGGVRSDSYRLITIAESDFDRRIRRFDAFLDSIHINTMIEGPQVQRTAILLFGRFLYNRPRDAYVGCSFPRVVKQGS